MQYVHPSRWPLPLLLAAGVGFVAGVFPPGLGLVTAVLVNLVLPFLALMLGALYPRIRVGLLAGLLLGLSFWLGAMVRR